MISSASVSPVLPHTCAGCQKDASAERIYGQALVLLHEMQHRTANVLHIAGLQLEVQARRSSAESRPALEAVAAGFRKLLAAHKTFALPDLQQSADSATEVRAAHAALAPAYASARPGVRFECLVDADLRGEVRPAGLLPLIVSEMVTNAFKHAFRGRDTGRLTVRLVRVSPVLARLSVVDDGPGFDGQETGSSSGMTILRALAEMVGGHLSIGSGDSECAVEVTFRVRPVH